MKASVTLTVALDEDFVISEASRRGVTTDVVIRELIGEIECAVVDVIYSKRGHGVEGKVSVRSELLHVCVPG